MRSAFARQVATATSRSRSRTRSFSARYRRIWRTASVSDPMSRRSVVLPGLELFFAEVHLLGGPAPVRRYLPKLIDLIWSRTINPGKVFDLHLPLEQVAEGYRAMDERRAIKTLLLP